MCFECNAAAKLATCFSDIGGSAVATGHSYEIFNVCVGRDCVTALLGISHPSFEEGAYRGSRLALLHP
eukprot:4733226-Alexandrium_andersonii.AAC.1